MGKVAGSWGGHVTVAIHDKDGQDYMVRNETDEDIDETILDALVKNGFQ